MGSGGRKVQREVGEADPRGTKRACRKAALVPGEAPRALRHHRRRGRTGDCVGTEQTLKLSRALPALQKKCDSSSPPVTLPRKSRRQRCAASKEVAGDSAGQYRTAGRPRESRSLPLRGGVRQPAPLLASPSGGAEASVEAPPSSVPMGVCRSSTEGGKAMTNT